MSAIVIQPETPDDERDAVLRTVQALAEGQLAVLPTETVYGIAASVRHPAAVQRIYDVKGRSAASPFALAVKGLEEMLDYSPDASIVARRVAQRCWPGPLTLVLDASSVDGLAHRLPAAVRQAVCPNGTIGFRVAEHRFLASVLQFLDGPVALTSANLSGREESITGCEAAASLGDEVAIVLDDGPCKYKHASTVLRVDGNRLHVLRDGVLGEDAIRRYASLMVLLVCTGNTCRSPMAEMLLQKRLADRLKCDQADLVENGVMVISAGVAAYPGAPAAGEAVQAMQQRGLDLHSHESRPLTETLVRFADVILTMTTGHRASIVSEWPEAAEKTAVLDQDCGDIPDPIGGPLELYERCASHIDDQLERWVNQVDLADLPVVLSQSAE